ncbi:MAG: NCS2 family permease [Endomicrobiales bacterium]|nr:NCS2 family permease [Endomicrobiales bacterium]
MKAIEKYFRLSEHGTTVKTEVLAGLTTFMTMAYIIFVNPAMISQAGLDFGSAMIATCIAAGFATMFMGLYANYPIALAPGMGINAFFTYTVCLTMKIPWQTALGCVFIEGIIFLFLTLTNVRQALVDSIPSCLRYGTACGIGLFIAFIGLMDAGVIASHPATFVTLGNVTSTPVLLSAAGFLIACVLIIKNVRGALLWAILITAVLGIPLGVVDYQGIVSAPPSMSPTFLKMDINGALNMGFISVVFIFLFIDIFDTVGTLAGVGEIGGFMKHGKLPRAGKAMLCDAVGTCVGASCGTPTVTSYIESAAGITAGGKTGLASVVTGFLFFTAIFFAPLIKMIGGGFLNANGTLLHPITAPALVLVGCMMLETVTKINWKDFSESIPAFIVMIVMPFTFSIATGIAAGFISFAALKIFTGRGKEVSPLVYVLAVIFIVRFIYLKSL